jgi:hypothetical protein
VHGVGVGRRRRAGRKTREYAVVVHVQRKLPSTEVPADRRVSPELRFVTREGREVVVPVDVQERGSPTPETGDLDLRARARPVPGGVSVGNAGTLGGWVWDTVTGQVVALSNRHVLAVLLVTVGVDARHVWPGDSGAPHSQRLLALPVGPA